MTAIVPAADAAAVWTWKLLIDDVVVPRELTRFLPIVGVFTALTLTRSLMDAYSRYLSTWLVSHFILELRISVFSHLESLSLNFFDRRRRGDVLSRLDSDVGAIQTFIFSGPIAALSIALRIVFFSVALFLISWQLALIAFITAPLFAVIARIAARLRRDASREERRLSGAVGARAQETLAAISLVQASGREEHEARRLREDGLGVLHAQLASARIKSAYGLLVDVIEAVGGLSIVGAGIYLLSHDGITVGGFLVFIAYLLNLYSPIRGFGQLTTTMFTAFAGAERVIELLDQEPTVRDPDVPAVLRRVRGRIDLRDVSFTYPGIKHSSLRGVTFRANPGEMVAIVGNSGAGKSTLAKLLVRFYDPDSGRIDLDGVDVRTLRLGDLRHNVGILSQEALLLHTSISNNISYSHPSASIEEIVAAAKSADAHEFISALPDGYETQVGQDGHLLSGGQRQRIAIARALLQNPPVLVLDEPTTGLDTEAVSRLMEPLQRLASGRTTIVISHNMLLAHEADRIVVLNNGAVETVGSARSADAHQQFVSPSVAAARPVRS